MKKIAKIKPTSLQLYKENKLHRVTMGDFNALVIAFMPKYVRFKIFPVRF